MMTPEEWAEFLAPQPDSMNDVATNLFEALDAKYESEKMMRIILGMMSHMAIDPITPQHIRHAFNAMIRAAAAVR
jgi:hypothetical protein